MGRRVAALSAGRRVECCLHVECRSLRSDCCDGAGVIRGCRLGGTPRLSHKKGARGLEPGALACGLRRGKGGRVKPLRTPRMLVSSRGMVTEIFRESVVYRLERNGLRWLYAAAPKLMDALRGRLCDDGGLGWTVRAEARCGGACGCRRGARWRATWHSGQRARPTCMNVPAPTGEG